MKRPIIIGDKILVIYSKNITGRVTNLKYNFGKRIYSVKVGGNIYDYEEDEIKKI